MGRSCRGAGARQLETVIGWNPSGLPASGSRSAGCRSRVGDIPTRRRRDRCKRVRAAGDPAASCAKAVAIYQGDLLEGIDSASAEFEEWLRPERERLGGIAGRLLEQVAQSANPKEMTDDAIRLGRQLLAGDRLREPVYRALMRLQVCKGERAEAMRLYATCREAL